MSRPFINRLEGRKFDHAVIRRLVAGLIVLGLAVGIWALWPREGSDPTPTTVPTAVATTTTVPPTTTSIAATTTTTTDTDVVATVEEAEEILRTLWYGWFEGIYNQDEARIREVVGTQAMLDAALAQFGTMEFLVPPESQMITITESDILRSDNECLAVWSVTAAEFRPGSVESVQVLRRVDDRWVFVGSWVHRDDLWEAECDSQLEPLSS